MVVPIEKSNACVKLMYRPYDDAVFLSQVMDSADANYRILTGCRTGTSDIQDRLFTQEMRRALRG